MTKVNLELLQSHDLKSFHESQTRPNRSFPVKNPGPFIICG